jgi:hypothetical protein
VQPVAAMLVLLMNFLAFLAFDYYFNSFAL